MEARGAFGCKVPTTPTWLGLRPGLGLGLGLGTGTGTDWGGLTGD